MKKFNLFFLFGLISIITFSFSSCSDDDDIGNTSELLGLWEPIHAEGYSIYDGEKDTWNKDVDAASSHGEYNRLEFLNGGIYNSYAYYNGWEVEIENGTYQLKGNKLHATHEEGTFVNTVISLTSTRMILESKENWDGEEYYEKITFAKIQ